MSDSQTVEETKNVALFHRWFEEVWNQGRAETIHEMIAPDCLVHGMAPDGSDLVGPGGFLLAHAAFRGAFPDMHIVTGPIVAEGDMVAGHFLCKATHLGDQLGVPPTGDPVSITGLTITRFHDGRIVEGWNALDLLPTIEKARAKAAAG